MRKLLRLFAVSAGALALVLSGAAVASASGSSGALTCTGGDIQSGSYASITVTGACAVAADAVITVVGDVYVGNGAALDAQSAPSTITVGRNVTAVAGSFLGLGCQPPSATGNSAHPCGFEPDGISDITVNGNITAVGTNTVMLNGVTVKGNVTLTGGGGEIPWTVKNSRIGGNLTVTGQTLNWIGVLFNRIGGNATLTGITVTDTDPEPLVFIGHNTITRNLVCVGLAPGVSGGFGPSRSNVVGRNAVGQCATLA